MRAFLATVLSVIAVGVLLIAYGLLAPRASASTPVFYDPQTGLYQLARPVPAGERILLPDSGAYGLQGAQVPYATPVGYTQAVYTTPVDRQVVVERPAVQTVRTSRLATPQRTVTRVVDDRRGRNWQKTALVIGGSTATGAGVGALVGGKKGALIGAAIGGGASTLYEARKDR
jgi:hypothetical protein